ncbi:MAG: N-acetylmuramoyl-L-alanine amidase [Oscillospiraceae bacterium]
MLIKINRKLLCVFLIAILTVACFVVLPYNTIIRVISQSADHTFSSNTVIIDAGHGGVDPGAIGANGCIEKDINLSIALCLRDMLTANGYKVIMTRDSDIALHDEKYKRIGQIKTSDLKNRLRLIDKNSDAITIMIHQNHFTAGKYNGAQMFYGRINDQSQPLAEALRQSFKENLQPNNQRETKRSSKDVYVLHNAKNPIVLAECGFISNYAEAELLCNEEYQQKVAFTIFSGIEGYKKTLQCNYVN